MKTRLSIFISCMMILTCIISNQKALARPPLYTAFEYKIPRDFVWWLHDKKNPASVQERFIKAYIEEQGYLLVPKIDDAALDDVCWGYEDVAVNYGFRKEDISWRMFVYPVKDFKKESYYSEDIEEILKKRGNVIELDKKYEHTTIMNDPQRSYYSSSYYYKKKLQLGEHTSVDCVQGNIYTKYMNLNRETVSATLHFFVEEMYVRVIGYVSALGQENKVADALKTCTFEKLPTNPRLTLEKKKNKVSKKNAILHATLQNPTNQDFTYTELYLYDKKQKRYRRFLRKKMTEKSKRKEKVALKFNVQKIIKDWRKRSIRRNKSSFPLERKKKYKYMVRTKVYGKYLEAKGTFKLK